MFLLFLLLKHIIYRVQRFLEKLVKLCSNPQLGLKRSPPYLLDLLPHMFQVSVRITLIVSLNQLRDLCMFFVVV